MSASFAGGAVAIVMSYISSGGKIEVLATINGVLGSLVGITAGKDTIITKWTPQNLNRQILYKHMFY